MNSFLIRYITTFDFVSIEGPFLHFETNDSIFIQRSIVYSNEVIHLYSRMKSKILLFWRHDKRSAREENLPFLICIIFSHKNVVWKPATRRRWNQFKCVFLARQWIGLNFVPLQIKAAYWRKYFAIKRRSPISIRRECIIIYSPIALAEDSLKKIYIQPSFRTK